MRMVYLAIAIASTFAFVEASALPLQEATPEERTAIGLALRERGYVRWEGVRRDDQGWRIESAWDAKGRRFALKLHPQTLRPIRTRRLN